LSDSSLKTGNQQYIERKGSYESSGLCEWTLSAVNLEFEYVDAPYHGKNLVPGNAIGATIAYA
jgi:hypothetical protein